MPRLDRPATERLIPIKGTPPSLINLPTGCAFHPRCAYEGRTNGAATARDAGAATPGRAGTRSAAICRMRCAGEIFMYEIKPRLEEGQ